MKLNYIPLLAILLIGVVFISGCTQQTTTPSETGQEKIKYVCQDGTTVDNISGCTQQTTTPSETGQEKIKYVCQDGTTVDNPELCPKTTPNVTISCTENWSCSEWTTCKSDNTQTRACIDSSNCGTVKDKPSILQSCSYSKPFDKFELKKRLEESKSCNGYCEFLDKISLIKYENNILYIEQTGTSIIIKNQEVYSDVQGRSKVVLTYLNETNTKPSTVQLKELITDYDADGIKIINKEAYNCYSSDSNCGLTVSYYTVLSWDNFVKMANIEMSYSEWLSETSVTI